MAAASCNDVHLSAGIEQHGFVTTPEVVKPQLLEPHLSYPTGKLLADVARAPWLVSVNELGNIRPFGQLYQGQIERHSVRHTATAGRHVPAQKPMVKFRGVRGG